MAPYTQQDNCGNNISCIAVKKPVAIWQQLTLSQIGKEAENYTENCEAGKVTLQQFFPGTALLVAGGSFIRLG